MRVEKSMPTMADAPRDERDGYGYVPISRKLFDTDPFWNERRVYSRAEAWIDLIRMAAYQPHSRCIKGSLVELERGEVLASIRFLADRWQWGAKRVRMFLDTLAEMGRIRAQSETHHGAVYLLVNYEDYNQKPDPEGAAGGTKRAHSGHTEGTKRSKGNKGKKENTPSGRAVERRDGWTTVAGEAWQRRHGGTAPWGEIGKHLKPLVDQYGAEEVLPVWERYLREEDPRYASAAKFSQKYGSWREAAVRTASPVQTNPQYRSVSDLLRGA